MAILFFITPTNNEEILSEKKDLENNKSLGNCRIPIKFLKMPYISPSKPVSLIANLSFSIRIIGNNYRPISILSNISKINEKFIRSRSITFLKR